MLMTRGTGWIPDSEDHRDYTTTSGQVQETLHRAGLDALVGAAPPVELPPAVDLREDFPPVVDQGQINSCTAHTAAALLSYFEQRAFGRTILPSRLFIYKVSRSLLMQTGDNGAYLRTAMEALRSFGAPPETYWPYVTRIFNMDPPPFCYSLAANYKAVQYFRVDRDGASKVAGEELLNRIRTHIAHGFPLMFGFPLYNSISQVTTESPNIPYPANGDKSIGLHAIVACGYDDRISIVNKADPGARATTGALLIRNSWGPQWAMGGYAWLPYEFVLQGLTSDWWGLLKADYLDTGEFGPVKG